MGGGVLPLATRPYFRISGLRRLLVVLLLCLASPARAPLTALHTVWLPLITSALAAANPVHRGIAMMDNSISYVESSMSAGGSQFSSGP